MGMHSLRKEKRLVRTADLTGSRFGRLLVKEFAGYVLESDGKSRAKWKCLCDCGNTHVVSGKAMKNGNTKSCGCLSTESRRAIHLKHGQSGAFEYQKWCSMKARCCNPNNYKFHNYGGRGITICQRWINSFENFLADMGRCPPGLTLERKNTNGNYEPLNCRWATRAEQAINRTTNHFIEHAGKRQTLSQWSTETGIGYRALLNRVRRGWSAEKSLTTPLLT